MSAPRPGGGPGREEARAAKARLLAELGDHPAVNGIGLVSCDGSYAVKVNLRSAERGGLTIPEHVDRVEVRVEVVGPIVAR